MMSEDERIAFALATRKAIETYLKDAELLMGMLKRNLADVDRHLGYLYEHDASYREIKPHPGPSPRPPITQGDRPKEFERPITRPLVPMTDNSIVDVQALDKKHTWMTDEEKQKILTWHVEGWTVYRIAKTLKRTDLTVKGYLKKMGRLDGSRLP